MITSKSNEQVKYIANLKDKKYRDMYSKFVLEGIKLVEEISSGENPPELIAYSEELLKNANGGTTLLKKLQNNGMKLIELSDKIFEYISDTVSPQGILAVVNIPKISIEDIIKALHKKQTFIILDKVQDPGNMGTILRNCAAFDIKNIICTKGTADIYSPKIVRSTMGAINKINFIYLTIDELKSISEKLKQSGYDIVGTDLMATKTLKDYIPTKETIYVMGNEANGVSDEIKQLVDTNIKIEMNNIQESLNVSVASGILLYKMYANE